MIILSTGTTDGLQKITAEQKIPLAAQWEQIAREYPVITNQAILSGITDAAELRTYKSAYSALDDFLHNADTGILTDMTALSFTDSAEYQKKWNDYYTDKAKLRLIVAVPPTNQVTGISLSATAKADKTIDITVTFRYTQGLFRASHFLLYRNTSTAAPPAIDTTSCDCRTIGAIPDAPDNHKYSITLNLPQVSGNVQLHYRFALSAAFLGSASLALHKDGVIDGGESWRDVTVKQHNTGSSFLETRLLESLSAPGSPQQIGLYQDQLYHWTDTAWKPLEALMPAAAIAYYDGAHAYTEETVIYELAAPVETGNKYEVVAPISLNAHKGKMIKIEVSGYVKRGNRRLTLSLFNNNWSDILHCGAYIEINAAYNIQKTQMVYIPTDYHGWSMGVWYPGSDDFNKCKAVVTGLRLTLIGTTQSVDTTRNGIIATGKNVTLENDGKLGRVYAFFGPKSTFAGNLTKARTEKWSHSRWIYIPDVEQKFYEAEIWHLPKTAYYNIITTAYNQSVDVSAYKGKLLLINVIAYRKGSGGYLTLIVCEKNAEGTIINSIYNSQTIFDASSDRGVPTFVELPSKLMSGSTGIFFTATFTPANNENKLMVRELSLYSYIKNNIRLFFNGMTDYAFLDYGSQHIYFYTYFNEQNNLAITVAKEKLIGSWHHLVVNNGLTDTQAYKEIWIDGKLIERKTQNGNFATLNKDREIKNINMSHNTDGFSWTQGRLAHLLYFDRSLTEPEIRWLYLNPQYPIKNYSLADWQLDNPEKHKGLLKKIANSNNFIDTLCNNTYFAAKLKKLMQSGDI